MRCATPSLKSHACSVNACTDSGAGHNSVCSKPEFLSRYLWDITLEDHIKQHGCKDNPKHPP